jgi:N-acetylglucosamine-6-sulfatase
MGIHPHGRTPLLSRWIIVASLVAILSTVALSTGTIRQPPSATASSHQPRPNILFILTDDQDVETLRFMPSVQRLLAAEGVTFVNTFAAQPLCCPSRASILRGQYPHNTDILHNAPPVGGFEKFRDLGHESSTLATWLQGAGYQTAMFGKYLNGYLERSGDAHVPAGWSEWYGASADPVTYYNQKISENGQVVAYGNAPSDYHTDVLTEKVITFIERRGRNAPPFFIYLSGPAPHCDCMGNGPATPAPRHLGVFADVSAPRPPSFNEADLSDKPPIGEPTAQLMGQLPLLTDSQIAELDDEYRTRIESLLAVDESIERIIGALSARGELENTYVFFTSDNGYHLGQHRIPRGKNTLYEESIRVPGIVRGPGVPAGLIREHFVLNIDFAPTFAELAGANIPEFVDGRSLVPLLGRVSPPLAQWRQDVLLEVTSNTGDLTSRALRTRDLVYFEYGTGHIALYDLREDPYQVRSLHETGDPLLMETLSDRLSALATCAGRNCRN